MIYEAYEIMRNMTYDEFLNAVIEGAVNDIIGLIVVAIIVFILGRKSKYTLSKENNRKLQKICKWEKRPMKYQVKHILEMFIEAYTEKNNINWDETLY